MVNYSVAAWNIDFEFDHGGATGRNHSALYVFVNQFTTFNIYFVEDFADNVERRYQVRTTVTNVHTNSFTSFGFQGIVAGDRAYVAVEYNVFRLFGNGFIHIERLQALGAFFTFSIEVALYDVELFVHFRQAFFRFNQDQTVHTVGDVHTDRSNGTVVNVQTGLQSFKAESRSVAWGSEGSFCTTALTGSSVEVNVVRNGRRRIVREFYFYGIAFAYTDHLARNVAVECPVVVFNTVFHSHGFFDGFHFNAYFSRMIAIDCRWNFRSVSHDGIDYRQF